MLQRRSLIKVSDNSNVSMVRLHHVYNKYNGKIADVGDVIRVSIVKTKANVKIHSKTCKALIIRVIKNTSSEDGSYLSSTDNAVIILNDGLNPVGTRIFGPVFKETNKSGRFPNVMKMAKKII